jgi:uncharacterized protein (UPF0297 family)
MKLIVQGNNIIACVSDDALHYLNAIPTPEGFNEDLAFYYTYDGTNFNLDISPILIEEVKTNLDTFAQQKGYDNILSVVSYINSSNTTYKNDANTAIHLRDETWTTLNEIINQIKANTIQVTSYSQIANSLPSLVWPV